MSDLQKAMDMLIQTFYKYSGKEGDKLTLSKGELKNLIIAELDWKSNDRGLVDTMFRDLDANEDGTVDFQEYVIFVARLTMATNEFFPKK